MSHEFGLSNGYLFTTDPKLFFKSISSTSNFINLKCCMFKKQECIYHSLKYKLLNLLFEILGERCARPGMSHYVLLKIKISLSLDLSYLIKKMLKEK
ncbi:hypothetical protein BpHYR1_036141 [Brachionus plicatilis]|uniref:Uncharacterized protein n=1 Tax=Brachionus plicatilis TaxID=10195 RepID=A0A3M7S5T0_BRAPC|nr:hypothetical protein BpHYR1_036141 [Brachionus plicatilis]